MTKAAGTPLLILVAGVLGGFPVPAGAQIAGSPAAADVLLTTTFRSPLSYEKALARLDEYYDQEIGRRSAAALPEIAPRQHFELWHDMWLAFDAGDGGTNVTIKRPADAVTARLTKGWMLNLAGRLNAAAPLEFKDAPPLRKVEGELYVSPKDLARVLQADSGLKSLPTWEHAGLMVSASPMISIVLAAAGLHGVHHVTVTAETAAEAKALWGRIQQGILKPGIYAASSEEVEIEEEIRNTAQGRVDTAGVTAPQAIYIPQMDQKLIESKLRADPEMSKRALAAQNQYDIRFRIDKAYRKVVVSWAELTGYSRADGKYQGERALGKGALAAPKMPGPAGAQLVARTKLETLKPGGYRVRLEGESPAGEITKIDERTYWFDGKIFEER